MCCPDVVSYKIQKDNRQRHFIIKIEEANEDVVRVRFNKVYAIRDYVMFIKQFDSRKTVNQNNTKIANYTFLIDM